MVRNSENITITSKKLEYFSNFESLKNPQAMQKPYPQMQYMVLKPLTNSGQ